MPPAAAFADNGSHTRRYEKETEDGLPWVEDQDRKLVAMATTIVDSSIARCAAWEMSKTCMSELEAHLARGGVKQEFVKMKNKSSIYHLVRDLGLKGVKHKEWLLRRTWALRSGNEVLVCVYESIDEHSKVRAREASAKPNTPPSPSHSPPRPPQIPPSDDCSRVDSAIMCKYEKLELIDGTLPQTRVSFYFQIDMGEDVPKDVACSEVLLDLLSLSRMRRKFDVSIDIDSARMRETAKEIAKHVQGEQDLKDTAGKEVLAEGNEFFEAFNKSKDRHYKTKKIRSPIPTVINELLINKANGSRWGKSATVVRASKEDILAYELPNATQAGGELTLISRARAGTCGTSTREAGCSRTTSRGRS
jgi:hypothetical protein